MVCELSSVPSACLVTHSSADTISALEIGDVPAREVSVALPPARWISRLWPESQDVIVLPHDCQARILEPGQALKLILTLVEVDCAAPRWLHDTQLKLQRITMRMRPLLQKSETWDNTAIKLLSCLKNAPLLQFLRSLLADCQQSKYSRQLQLAMSNAILETLRLHQATAGSLLSCVVKFGENEQLDGTEIEPELAMVAATWLIHLDHPRDAIPVALQDIAKTLLSGNLMADDPISTACQALVRPKDTTTTQDRSPKRRKLTSEGHGDRKQELQAHLGRLLTGTSTEDLTSMPQMAASAYAKLNADDQETAWTDIAELAALDYDNVLLIMTITQLVNSAELQKSKTLRVISMGTVQACLERATESMTALDLGNSPLGQYCLRSLQSSLRELRLAAGRCLPVFLSSKLPDAQLSRNRQIAFQCLRTLSDRNVAGELETLIAAWGSVAAVSEDKELNLALLQLVDLLGHTNPLVCGLAFSEIENVAQSKGVPALKLFKPYWSSIAVSVVLDIHLRPQKIQQLCSILGMDVNQFLTMTEGSTVPSLVLHRKKEILQRIANARGADVTIHDVCLQPRSNMTAILTLLLLSQPGADVEESAFQCLTEVSSGFRAVDLDTLVKAEPTQLACELLKFIGEQPQEKKSRAYQAFNVFVNLAERPPGKSKAHSKIAKTLSAFFGIHVLGIMTSFSYILSSDMEVYRTLDKMRCIWGISEMALLAKEEVTIALPQIRACLQYAIEQPDLCETAWIAWLSLLPNLESEDISLIADQTFALIIKHWDRLSPDSQQLTHERIAEMIRAHNTTINEIVMMLPSLSHIPLLHKFGAEVERLQGLETDEGKFKAFAKRLQGESPIVVVQALQELVPFLEAHQGLVHDAAVSEQPEQWLSDLVRSLLDATAKMANHSDEAAELCGKCLGLVGCLDPNRVDASRLAKPLMVMSNFENADETVEWVVFFLENVLVKAFKSVSNARAQGFLAYVMQELLRFCGFKDTTALRPRGTQGTTITQRWQDMPEHVRTTLTPFLTSRYVTTTVTTSTTEREYPGFSREIDHSSWLRSLVYDLTGKAKGDNPKMVFPLLARIVRGHDLSIAMFVLPYVLTNVVLGGTVTETKGIQDEIAAVLKEQSTNTTETETIRLCSETVFNCLDYMCVWLREKKKAVADIRANAYRTGQSPNDFNEIQDQGQIETIEQFLATIPANLVATRAMECGTYARALFNWEQYIRQSRPLIPLASSDTVSDEMNDRLIDIYAQIDEPDGLEGISAHLSILTDQQQATLHARAGRWTAAQAWYELQLAGRPNDEDLQTSLLQCLRETGRYAPLLRYADSFLAIGPSIEQSESSLANLLPSAIEACCMINDSASLTRHLELTPETLADDYNVGIGYAVHANNSNKPDVLMKHVKSIRKTITTSMTAANGSSLHGCHTELRRLHILSEIEMLKDGWQETPESMEIMFENFEKRLSAVGSYISDKQSILGIRRAMFSHNERYSEPQMGALWLTTARLARKAGNTEAAYNAVLRAYECGDKAAKLEEARLLWRDGHGRQAISALEGAIKNQVFDEESDSVDSNSLQLKSAAAPVAGGDKQNMLLAKAHLLLAKWLDASGQTQTKDMTAKYQYAAKTFQRWEKGHYYLGKHYNKLLEVEKLQPKSKQSSQLLCGELSRLVVENLLRSIPFGNKYWHETIPKILTLWLDLGLSTQKRDRSEPQDIFDKRARALTMCNKQIRKYFDRVPPYIFYQALPQMLSRISHPHPEVWKELSQVISKIASTYPSQALWSLLAVSKATDRVRHDRAVEVINKLRDPKLKSKNDSNATDLRMMIASGQRLSDGLLLASEAPVEPRQSHASLSRDLGFNHKLAPCSLVVPLETTLTASMPAGADSARIRSYAHKAFAHDKITIQSFEDSVLVLSSLQRPKKVTVKGSDGKPYGLLCKPKDDLRKDQRLMEFNGVINRALKRDAEASKRRLYIKTYAVTPLSEESGILEWVEGIKPIRDILLQIYSRKGIRPNYAQIRNDLNEACKKSPSDGGKMFLEKVQSQFPACLHEWFTEVYPEPDTWFNARLRYARTAAVMSMTGHVLGLGDRHGENILLQESTGGVFHVDFNCLFDKGSTFEKPEVVPFRLTHNMVDAMGPYGYEGPFRRSSELTLGLLRQNKDTLNTILETFLYDPTTDFVGKKKRHTDGVPETPQEILDSVGSKLKGYYKKEMVPLSVEGYADALIRDAVDPWNLCQMYIGWCAFL